MDAIRHLHSHPGHPLLQKLRDSLAQVSHQLLKIIVSGSIGCERDKWRLPVPTYREPEDIFLQAQFPLHSGRILGLPGRIFVSATGLLVPMLSVTGITIWQKKRLARIKLLGRI
jgi:hypothetical protein